MSRKRNPRWHASSAPLQDKFEAQRHRKACGNDSMSAPRLERNCDATAAAKHRNVRTSSAARCSSCGLTSPPEARLAQNRSHAGLNRGPYGYQPYTLTN